ncbi:MAG TPA: SUMF1/EgtB/PvdO family nonheme iron enzyme, partial [Polyangiaceae bacterium]
MRAWVVAACVVLAACGKKGEGSGGPGPSAGTDAGADAGVDASAGTDAGAGAKAANGTDAATSSGPCPDDMAFVETSYCPDIERRCLDMEHEEKNNLAICHAFEHEERCRNPGEEKKLAVCIDRYEYPNVKGGHPVWMLDWYQAQATCESKGKRLCDASEWTAACEGPEHTPFPYGWERDHDKCNMDNFYIDPKKPAPHAQFFFYSKDPAIAFKELSRLDESIPSGSMESCKSGFGVYDMPGNVDEWVVNDGPPHEKSKWAGLKGGAWGHVRSQCRPETFSHEPEFTYYFVGFRCCRDAAGVRADETWAPSPQAVPPPVVEPHDFAPEPLVPVDPPGPSKTKYAR